MAWTVEGTFGINTYRITYDNGQLRGDPRIVEILEFYADVIEGRSIGWEEGPRFDRDYLSTEAGTFWLVMDMLDNPIVTGNPPVRPPIPDGAIG